MPVTKIGPAPLARLDVAHQAAEALFCSWLDPCDEFDAAVAARALRASLAGYAGPGEMTGAFAQRYGEEPQRAAARRRWCLRVLARHPRLTLECMPIGHPAGSIPPPAGRMAQQRVALSS